jgi:serine/threonine protein kinase
VNFTEKIAVAGAAPPVAENIENEDPRVVEAVEKYLEILETGQVPDRERFLAQYSDVATVLAECLDGLRFMYRTAPAVQKTVEPARDELTGTKPLGDYRIVREIGRGGMGVVYEAEQLSLGRRAAVKVLPFAAALDGKHQQRFKNEARAAAQLQHPNIVPVYAVGCDRGVHYYAMQFVDGQSLAAVIRALRPASGPAPATPLSNKGISKTEVGPSPALVKPETDINEPASAPIEQAIQARRPSPAAIQTNSPSDSGPLLTWAGNGSVEALAAETSPAVAGLVTERSQSRPNFYRRVAELGKAAAEALEHAHQSGVVHRDVKPANLMLDGQGHLWITDFGLAYNPNNAGITTTGEVVGTLRYMSPEQASAKHGLVDHRTDIYSLGVTLYELLTLEPAFQGDDRQQLLEALANKEPPPPRHFDKRIPRELETIILKAMCKNPNDRYATAQEMAEDLQCFLDDKPIMARRPNLWEKTAHWGRRHRKLVFSAVAVLLTSSAVLAGTTVLLTGAWDRERQKAEEALILRGRAEAKADEAKEQRAFAETKAKEAEQQKKLAEDRAEEIKEQRDLAQAYFEHAQKSIHVFRKLSDELGDDPAMQGVRRRLLENAVEYYEAFLELDDTSDEVLESQAEVYQILTELSTLRGSTLVSILQDINVKKDLKLSVEQNRKVDVLARKFAQRWGHAFMPLAKPLPPEERRKKALETARVAEKEVEDILSAEQKRRFKQVALQVQQRSRFGFSDPQLVKDLDLTSDQLDKIRNTLNETYAKTKGLQHVAAHESSHAPPAFGGTPGKGKKTSSKSPSGKKLGEFGKKVSDFGKKVPPMDFGKKETSAQDKKRSELWEEALGRIVTKVFTQEQQEKWRGLTGTPVRVEIYFDYFDGLGMRHPMMSMNPPGHGNRPFPPMGDRERDRKGHDR